MQYIYILKIFYGVNRFGGLVFQVTDKHAYIYIMQFKSLARGRTRYI